MDKYTIDETQYKNGYRKGYEDGKRDAVEVVHGRWIQNGGDLHYSGVLYCCSVCGKKNFVNGRHALVTLHYHDELFNKPNYCPYCGAKMDGGKSEQT